MIGKTFVKTGAAALALFSLAQPSLAHANQCVSEQDLDSAAQFMMPSIVAALKAKCSGQLSEDGFFATQSEDFLEPYIEEQDKNWPGTFRFFKAFAADAQVDASLFDALPEEIVRPMIETTFGTMLVKDIKTTDCSKIERGMEYIAPLPPENIGGLIGFVVVLVEEGNAKKGKKPRLCIAKND